MEHRTVVLVADYGLNQYYGGLYDLEARLRALQSVGYDGLERLPAHDEPSVVANAAIFRKLGMRFTTASAPSPDLTIRWAAALGCEYVWVSAQAQEFDAFCRQARAQAEACAAAGIRVALHNHMGTAVETQEELEAFLTDCPECGLILDTAHLAAVEGDPVAIVHKYAARLVQVHFKDWVAVAEAPEWYRRGHFCELGAGNIGLDNAAVARALLQVGYAGTVAVEQDTHLHDPLEDLRVSREYLRAAGL
jgi:sugar phosphate isomerase/epimerase